MQSDDLEETLRIFQNHILDGIRKFDCLILSPTLLGALLKDPHLKNHLEFSFGENHDPEDTTILISESFTKPYGLEWVEVGEDPELSRQELLEHRITGSLKLKGRTRRP